MEDLGSPYLSLLYVLVCIKGDSASQCYDLLYKISQR